MAGRPTKQQQIADLAQRLAAVVTDLQQHKALLVEYGRGPGHGLTCECDVCRRARVLIRRIPGDTHDQGAASLGSATAVTAPEPVRIPTGAELHAVTGGRAVLSPDRVIRNMAEALGVAEDELAQLAALDALQRSGEGQD